MQFYVHHDGQQQGPLALELVRARLADGSYLGSDLGWHEGATDWLPLAAIPALAGSVAVPPLPTGAFPPQRMPAYASQPPRTSGLAIASLVLGLLGLFSAGLAGIPGVICGHLSLGRIKRSAGTLAGRGMAIGGLITGYLGICVFVLAVLAGIALPVFNAVQDKGLAVRGLAEAKQIGLACKLYAGDHQGDFPPTLDDLVPKYLPDKHLLVCPLGKGHPESGYDYFGGKTSDPNSKVLLSSKATTRNHQRIVVHIDDSVALERD